MKTRRLPTLVINTSNPIPLLHGLAKAIDMNGAAAGFNRVWLITPKLQKQKRDGSLHVEGGKKRRLFNRDGGYFHGTNHHLGNELSRSEFVGNLVMLTNTGQQHIVMALRPSEKRFGSADTVRLQPPIDPAFSISSIGEFLDLMNWPAPENHKPVVAKPTHALDVSHLVEFLTGPLRPNGDGTLDVVAQAPA